MRRRRRSRMASESIAASATSACSASTSTASELWRHKLKLHATRLGWGTAASPVMHRDRLYLVNDNDEESYLLALDAKTGNEVWRVARDEKSNWATPFVWENGQRTEIVTPGTGKVRSYDLDGKLLWSLKGMSSITIATPYEPQRAALFQLGLRAGSRRSRSTRFGRARMATFRSRTARRRTSSSPGASRKQRRTTRRRWFTTDRLYVLYDRGLVSCFNASDGTGALRPAAAAQRPRVHVFALGLRRQGVLSERRRRHVRAQGERQFELLHTNTLAEDDMCMATPAIAGDRLLIRTVGSRVLHPGSSTPSRPPKA